MKLKSDKQAKGIVFAGCSFTWGQGLYYYSNLPTLVEPPPYAYDRSLLKETHIEFMKSVRFPRLVANHFETFELVQPFNGGATYSILDWWNSSFEKEKNALQDLPTSRYDYSDVSHVVYQCTQWHRSNAIPKFNGQASHYTYYTTHKELFLKWLDENNLSLDEYFEMAKQQDINDIKTFLQNFENHGIKTSILTWPDDMVTPILNDSWLKERYIDFEYEGNKYGSIESLIQSNRYLEIIKDYNSFLYPDTPKDGHPSLKCHKIIAENIIRKLENV
jgi:hypothetical protein